MYIYHIIYIYKYIMKTYLIMKTMCPPGSRLSPQWLCGNSCTCAQDVYTYDNMITSILCPSFCEIWALCVSWITYGDLYICICIYIYNLYITICMYIYIYMRVLCTCCIMYNMCTCSSPLSCLVALMIPYRTKPVWCCSEKVR